MYGLASDPDQNLYIYQYISEDSKPDLKTIDLLCRLRHPHLLNCEGLLLVNNKLILLLPLTQRKLSDLDYEPFLTSTIKSRIHEQILTTTEYLNNKFDYEVYLNGYHPYLLVKNVQNPAKMTNVTYPKSYSNNHREVLKYLIFKLDVNKSVEFLFLAVDLFNRLEEDSELLANACIQIAEELLNLEISNLPSDKLKAIYLLNGCLNHSKYYHLCCNIDELKYVFDNIIMNKDSKVYLGDDFEKMINSVERVHNNKVMTINEFLNT
jgi:hypothetical protein